MNEAMYTDAERSLLDAWFARTPPTRRQASLLRVQGFGTAPAGLYTTLDAWVGSFAVQHIQHRLPNCGISFEDGEVILTRTRRKVRSQAVTGLARFLFGINWATSGPGITWPADYHLAWLPGYERLVLTYSADSPEVLGYCDFALGHVSPKADWRAEVRQIVVADWSRQWQRHDQWPWEGLTDEGHVGREEAYEWRREAWKGHEVIAQEDGERPDEDADHSDAETAEPSEGGAA